MAKKLYPRLLVVEVFQLKPTLWEWRVFQGDTALETGTATSRETAQIDGDGALFRMLCAGSDQS
jgi:hypothetical protein